MYIFFQQYNNPKHTLRLCKCCVILWTRKEMECCDRRPAPVIEAKGAVLKSLRLEEILRCWTLFLVVIL